MASDPLDLIVREQPCRLWSVLVITGIVFLLASGGQFDGAEPKVGTGTGTETVPINKEEVRDDGQVDQHALQAEITKFDYDDKCQLLAVLVQLKNVSDKPIFVVAEDFAFVRILHASVGHHLGVEQTSRNMTLDLSPFWNRQPMVPHSSEKQAPSASYQR
ncbi:MAG: hypothetical protein R3C10_06555 [Pirellulales bacterium]